MKREKTFFPQCKVLCYCVHQKGRRRRRRRTVPPISDRVRANLGAELLTEYQCDD